MKKLFTLLLAVAASIGTMFAWDYERVQIGDLYYNLDATNQTAEVTSQNSSDPYWSTTITTANIPASVEYNSVTYSVTSIGNSAFEGCTGLTSVTIPNSVTSIGDRAFYDCGINKIYFSGTMEEWLNKSWTPRQVSYSYSLFINDVAVTNVVIPNSVTSIGYHVFYGCTGLTSVTIPNSVTSIGEGAFYGCNNLMNVIISSSVKVLEVTAFANCSSIESITCYGQRPPTVNQYALYGLDYSTIVYVPADYLETYKSHEQWGLYDVRPLDATDLKYTITWKNYDGSVLETDENVAAGTIPTYEGETPSKPDDEQYTYTFAGWSPSVVTVTGEKTYIATFSATFKANTYTIHVNQDCTSYMEEQQ